MFDKLPGNNIQYPIEHYPSIPARPVIPTAGMAAQTAALIAQLATNLSPEHREALRLQAEHLRFENEHQRLTNEAAQREAMKQQRKDAAADAYRDSVFGAAGIKGSGSVAPDTDNATTESWDYHGANPFDRNWME
jgi:hypothetical protein